MTRVGVVRPLADTLKCSFINCCLMNYENYATGLHSRLKYQSIQLECVAFIMRSTLRMLHNGTITPINLFVCRI